MAFMVMKHVGFSFNNLFSEAMAVHPKGVDIMKPGGLVKDPISALSLGLGLMFGTAGLPHILMRFLRSAMPAKRVKACSTLPDLWATSIS